MPVPEEDLFGDRAKLVPLSQSKPRSHPSRWRLRVQALVWRFLMELGMLLHRLAPPRPHKPSFTRQIPTTLSPNAGVVTLFFYTPKDYKSQKRLNKQEKRYPVVLNFHGGGFTLGSATDDARWATSVVEHTGAVVASVDYRLAPEFPFPTAVEDGVDAVLYIIRHAEELFLDASRIAISGFSAGGNLTFTVPMRLIEEVDPGFDQVPEEGTGQVEGTVRVVQSTVDGMSDPERDGDKPGPTDYKNSSNIHPTKGGVITMSKSIDGSVAASAQSIADTITEAPEAASLPPFKIVALVSWYPSCDYTLSREKRRETLLKEGMEISPVFTDLFDAAYMNPPDIDKSNPYLSPGVASDVLLRKGLPDHIMIYTCEWDMLRAEALKLKDRLEEMGKRVVHDDVKAVPHAWDKSPNPFKEPFRIQDSYRNACKQLRIVFHGEEEHTARRSIAERLSIGGRLSISGKHTATTTKEHSS